MVFGVMEQVIQFFRLEDSARDKDYLAPPTCGLGFYRWCVGIGKWSCDGAQDEDDSFLMAWCGWLEEKPGHATIFPGLYGGFVLFGKDYCPL